MSKLFCAALVTVAFVARGAVADCCSGEPAKTAAKKSIDQQQAKAAEKNPQAKTENQQANASARSFSYEPAPAIEYYPRAQRSYPYSLQNDPKIIGSYGRRPASDKVIANY